MAFCELTNHKYSVGNKRSKSKRTKGYITRRTLRRFEINLVNKWLPSPIIGNRYYSISNKTRRTIDKYGSLDNFLLKMKRKNLSEEGRKLRQKVYKRVVIGI